MFTAREKTTSVGNPKAKKNNTKKTKTATMSSHMTHEAGPTGPDGAEFARRQETLGQAKRARLAQGPASPACVGAWVAQLEEQTGIPTGSLRCRLRICPCGIGWETNGATLEWLVNLTPCAGTVSAGVSELAQKLLGEFCAGRLGGSEDDSPADMISSEAWRPEEALPAFSCPCGRDRAKQEWLSGVVGGLPDASFGPGFLANAQRALAWAKTEAERLEARRRAEARRAEALRLEAEARYQASVRAQWDRACRAVPVPEGYWT